MKHSLYKISTDDSVAVALKRLSKGDEIESNGSLVILRDDVAAGHKVALRDIIEGETIIKYGYPIGYAKRDIKRGECIDHYKIGSALKSDTEYSYTPTSDYPECKSSDRYFMGYQRINGEVGIRNEIAIIPTVGCVNGTVESIERAFREELTQESIQCVDAIRKYPHNYGCSQLGDDHENTRKILRDIALHPNIGGALIVGLGCENNQIDAFKELIESSGVTIGAGRIAYMEAQKMEDEVTYGVELLRGIFEVVKDDRRSEIPISKLRIGVKCGGSDGFSGITANPLVGQLSDFITGCGGTTIVTEVPEMFGAEQLLMNRAATEEVFNQSVALIRNFKSYFTSYNQPIYENPSPGNKAGGISTLEEKSLGCVQKSGKAMVRGVIEYGERIRECGLQLLNAPGNDLVASTALAAAGCHMVLFTTGRGTPFGTFVPTLKISSNSALQSFKSGWIDFDAGRVLDGTTKETILEELKELVIETASGKRCRNEITDHAEIAIFKNGVTL